MSDKAASDLSSAGTLDGTEVVYIVKGGNSRRTTVADVAAAFLFADRAANRFLAGPTTGPDADPTFRAIVEADLPSFISSAVQGDILYRGASGWSRLAAGTNGYFLKTQGAGANPLWATSSGAVIPGTIWGLTLANNAGDATNDIDISAGAATDSANAATITLASAITKRSDATWAVGTGNGWLDSGAIGNGSYFVFLIERSDTGVVDSLLSLSPTAPTMPANYDRKRRIGAIVRAGGTIKAFVQDGDRFTWATAPVADIASTNPGTSAVTRTLTVPVGIRVTAHIQVSLLSTNLGSGAYISDLAITDNAASSVNSQVFVAALGGGIVHRSSAPYSVLTNTSGQVRSRLSASDASATLNIATEGWTDTRGF